MSFDPDGPDAQVEELGTETQEILNRILLELIHIRKHMEIINEETLILEEEQEDDTD